MNAIVTFDMFLFGISNSKNVFIFKLVTLQKTDYIPPLINYVGSCYFFILNIPKPITIAYAALKKNILSTLQVYAKTILLHTSQVTYFIKRHHSTVTKCHFDI